MNIRRTARLLALGFLGLGATAAHAAADGSQLALPPGATVAIVVFEDLQCPDCARAHPGLLAAAEASKVPLMFVIGPGVGASPFVEVMDPGEIGDVIARMGKPASP